MVCEDCKKYRVIGNDYFKKPIAVSCQFLDMSYSRMDKNPSRLLKNCPLHCKKDNTKQLEFRLINNKVYWE